MSWKSCLIGKTGVMHALNRCAQVTGVWCCSLPRMLCMCHLKGGLLHMCHQGALVGNWKVTETCKGLCHGQNAKASAAAKTRANSCTCAADIAQWPTVAALGVSASWYAGTARIGNCHCGGIGNITAHHRTLPVAYATACLQHVIRSSRCG